MSLSLVLLWVFAQNGAPSPAVVEPLSNLRAEAMWALRFEESRIIVEEFWTLTLSGAAPATVRVPVPAEATGVTIDEQVTDFRVNPAQHGVESVGEFKPGSKQLGIRYFMPSGAESLQFNRMFPFVISGLRLIVEHSAGLKIETPFVYDERISDLSGQKFHVYTLKPNDVLTGFSSQTPIQISLRGLPTIRSWPRWLAVAFCVLVLFWMLRMLKEAKRPLPTQSLPTQSLAETTHVLLPEARQARILQAIDLLENDYRASRVKPQAYHRRRTELVATLAELIAAQAQH